MDMILSGLYIGNFRDARDEVLLNRNKITHILKLLLFARPLTQQHHYLCIKVNDAPSTNIAQYFAICNDFIHNARLEDIENNNVLVHCYQGLSRSVSVTIAYIMTVTDLGFNDAWRVVRSIRIGARPNLFFQQQLHDFEVNQLLLERYRLRKRFPNGALYSLDRLRCRAILDNYDLLLLERVRFNENNQDVWESTSDTELKDNEEDINPETDANDTTNSYMNKAQKDRMHKALQRMSKLRELIDPGTEVDLEGFEKTILMPTAIHYRVLSGNELKRKRGS